ncbi:putative cardiolipin synthase [Pseudomonas aeruginosa]|nr:putative cardiolipin synthase [Pseudomonas aeruginosa]
MVFDRRKVFIGSFNFDPRSILWNTEVGVIVDSPLLAEQVRQLALEGMAPSVSYQVRIDRSGSRPKLVWDRRTRRPAPGPAPRAGQPVATAERLGRGK